MTEPLDWRELTFEAMRRRKTEGMTQDDLARLAGVSRATVMALERGETSLRLDKALEILRVLGLATSTVAGNDQDSFVREARERWHQLTDPLPEDAPARFPQGYLSFDYEIPGIPSLPAGEFLKVLQKAAVHQTGWPPFWFPTRDAVKPAVKDGIIECWLGRPHSGRVFDDPAHNDFWRASPAGRLYLQRGYQEDGPDVLEPGTILDLILPIWRCGEVLLHAQSLAHALAPDQNLQIKLRARFTGLSGRELVAWAKPSRRHSGPDRYRSRTDEVVTSIATQSGDIRSGMASLVRAWVTPLYDRFDFPDLSEGFVQQEVTELTAPKRHLTQI